MSFHKRPPVEELAEALNSHRYVTVVARHYDTSRQSVHEWIKYYKDQQMLKHSCGWQVVPSARSA